jgi:DNA repair protein RadC
MKTYKSSIKKFRIVAEKTDFQKTKISTSKDAADFIRKFYFDDIEVFESFFILMMNSANNTTGYAKISQGGINGTVVDTMIVARYVVENMAKMVVLAHNHPSGRMQPSDSDKRVTESLIKALKLFDCTVVDHIILSPEENKYFSFADEGIL